MTFDQFDLHDDLLAGVDAMNYQKATPIQELAIPLILDGKDLIACAQTGTGKTAAYLIPLLDRISHGGFTHTSTLILVPTRELAKQIDEQVEGFAYFVSATSLALYGGGKGENWDQQRTALTTGADIIIATPGRLMAHMQLGYVDFSKLNYLVLDEADKMLDMGFSDDILKIVRQLPTPRQTLLFSATMPNRIRDFSKQILNAPEEIRLAVSKPAEKIDQRFYMANDRQKLPLLMHLIQQTNAQSMVLFTSRKSEVNAIVREINKLGIVAHGISSDIEQDDRERVLRGFKNKQFPILVATDVLSRGIDIDSLSHVVNYDVPRDAEDYVHRIGRTARAGGDGMAITFVNENDQQRVVKIEKLLERTFDKQALTEELGYGPPPDFDPKRFREMGRGDSRNGGRPGGGSSGGGGRGNNDRRNGSGGNREGGKPNAARPRPENNRANNGGGNRDRRENSPRPAQIVVDGIPATPVSIIPPLFDVTAGPQLITEPQLRADGSEKPKKPRRRKSNNRGKTDSGGTVETGLPVEIV